MAEVKQIDVQAVGDDRKVVLYEKNAVHPNGQAFIANNGKVHTVAETPRVKEAIAQGILQKAEKQAKAKTEENSEEDEANPLVKRGPGRPRKDE